MSGCCQDEYNELQGEFVHGFLRNATPDERWKRMSRLLALAKAKGAEQAWKDLIGHTNAHEILDDMIYAASILAPKEKL